MITDVKEYLNRQAQDIEWDYNDVYNLYNATLGYANGIFAIKNDEENIWLRSNLTKDEIILTPQSAKQMRDILVQKYVIANGFTDIETYWSWHYEIDKDNADEQPRMDNVPKTIVIHKKSLAQKNQEYLNAYKQAALLYEQKCHFIIDLSEEDEITEDCAAILFGELLISKLCKSITVKGLAFNQVPIVFKGISKAFNAKYPKGIPTAFNSNVVIKDPPAELVGDRGWKVLKLESEIYMLLKRQ